MKYSNYRKIGGPNGHLAKREEFRGNTMGGRICTQQERRLYEVYSYRTVIAFVDEFGRVHVPPDHYSVTTTRHQNMCLAWMK